MTHLGSFGTERETVDEVTFDYFGERIHANPEIGQLDYIDFMESLEGIDLDNAEKKIDPKVIGLVKRFGRMCVLPDDFERFWATAKKHRQDISDVFAVCQAIVEVTADRPTERSSSSADTPTTEGTKSAGVSSSLAERLDGRPDLQLVVQRSMEAQAAKAG